MSDKETKERIEEEHLQAISIKYRESQYKQIAIGKDKATAITASLHAQVGFRHGYRAAKESERPKVWNEAIERCIQIIERADGDRMVYTKYLIKELESEKHKQS